MTQPEPAHVPEILSDLAALGFACALESTPGQGWLRLDDYVDDGETLDEALRLAGTRFAAPTPSPLTAGWLVADIAASICWPIARVALDDGPRLVTAASDIHLPDPHTGVRRAVRLSPPAEAGPATPGLVAEGIVAALTPVVDAIHVRTRRGRHALWGTVTDMVAAAFQRVGDSLGRGAEARRRGTEVIDASPALVGGTNWCDVRWSGGTESTRVRNICCLWYQSDDGGLCVTCPRLTSEQRLDLVERRRRSR